MFAKKNLIKSLIRKCFFEKKEEMYHQIYKNVLSSFCYLSIKHQEPDKGINKVIQI